MSTMTTHSDIIRRATTPAVIKAVGVVSIHTVRSWIQRNSIPSEHWAALANAGLATLDELAAAAAEKLKAA